MTSRRPPYGERSGPHSNRLAHRSTASNETCGGVVKARYVKATPSLHRRCDCRSMLAGVEKLYRLDAGWCVSVWRAKARFDEPSSASGEPSASRQPVAHGWCEMPSPSKASRSACARVVLLALVIKIPVLLYDFCAVLILVTVNFYQRVRPTSVENKNRNI